MQHEVSALTHVGRKRTENQDAFHTDQKLGLYVVADGMGGHAAGSIASEKAIAVFAQEIERRQQDIARFIDGATGRETVSRLLEDAVRKAGEHVFQMAQKNKEMRGMGTTLSALLLTPGRGFIAHVGDSRIYLVREKEVVQITEDHSLVNELIRQGRLRPNDRQRDRYSNAITRAVGVYSDVKVDTFDFELMTGDTFLLCSDGLSQYLRSADELSNLLTSFQFSELAKVAIKMANRRGGSDNSTAIFVRLNDETNQAINPTLPHRVKVLSKMPMFQHLTYKELVEVLNISEVRTFESGHYIFRENDLGEEMYVILSGRISVESDDIRLATLGMGGHFGEMAILDKGQRSANAKADKATEALVIERKSLFRLLQKDASIAVKILWCLTQILNRRLRSTNSALLKASISEEADDLSNWAHLTTRDD
ncbi:MAG: Stp1/IreP family PP2C-type Ser/Thr phosphatase [Myxococcota bacterium]|nr:Stp1/IreP family PP2C-type Ser/Thr phosphatase [Myxococcota bacterium]